MALTNCTEMEKVVMKTMTAATTRADSYTGLTVCGVLLLVSYPLESIASSRLLYEVGLLVLLPLYNAESLSFKEYSVVEAGFQTRRLPAVETGPLLLTAVPLLLLACQGNLSINRFDRWIDFNWIDFTSGLLTFL